MEHRIDTHLDDLISIEGVNIKSIEITIDIMEHIKILQHTKRAIILSVQSDESRTDKHQQIYYYCTFHDAKILKK